MQASLEATLYQKGMHVGWWALGSQDQEEGRLQPAGQVLGSQSLVVKSGLRQPRIFQQS